MNVNFTARRGSLDLSRVVLSLVAVAGLASSAVATDGRNPGSLLLYPEFDNRAGVVTVVTVTNVDVAEGAENIIVEFQYVGRYGPNNQEIPCLAFDRTETLTPGDNFTAITNFHNPNQEQGFIYLFAKDNLDRPVVHNYLTGNIMTVDGLTAFEYSVNPVSYRGIRDNGELTDLDNDGYKDMDGCEYSTNPDTILIPRFLGQGGVYFSELILIGLTGGAAFNTTVDFLIFNDNEEIFSSEHEFRCWERIPLLFISGIFGNQFLQNWTDDDPDEMGGAPWIETGWIHIQGALASSVNTSILDPSVYAVLVERIDSRGASDLPFEQGERDNGEFFPLTNEGDLGDFDCGR